MRREPAIFSSVGRNGDNVESNLKVTSFFYSVTKVLREGAGLRLFDQSGRASGRSQRSLEKEFMKNSKISSHENPKMSSRAKRGIPMETACP